MTSTSPITPLQIGDVAPDVALRDDGNQPVLLSERWRQQPLVLFFIRHFG